MALLSEKKFSKECVRVCVKVINDHDDDHDGNYSEDDDLGKTLCCIFLKIPTKGEKKKTCF